MSNSIRKTAIALLALFAAAMLALALVFLPATASAATSTAEQENTYGSGTLRRAVKVENDSFTITYKNDCTDSIATFGMAFFNSPEATLNLGDINATNQGLVFYVMAENYNVYNSKQWTETTQLFMEEQGTGWLITPYSVNKTTHMTVSKGPNDEIVLSIYSEGGNSFYQNGVTLQPELFEKVNFGSGPQILETPNELHFSDLVDENGYTYFNVNVAAAYAFTMYDDVTSVNDVTFTYEGGKAADPDSLSIVGALGADGEERYIAEAAVTENGYSFIGPDVEKLIFSDGTARATVSVGDSVVLPALGYQTENVLVGQTDAANQDSIWSLVDSSYDSMVTVNDNAISFDIGIKYDSAPAGNVNFNICIGPNSWVQTPAQNVSDASEGDYGPGIFSLFMTLTPSHQLHYSFYNYTWTQFTGDVFIKTLTVGEWNHVTLEIKQVDGMWGVYFDGTLISGSNAGGTLDFNTQYGDSFMNENNQTNIAFTGWNWPKGNVGLFVEQVTVSASVSTVSGSGGVDGYVTGAEDAEGNPVPLFGGSVSEEGYFFITLDPQQINKLSYTTYGGVSATAEGIDYASDSYDWEIVFDSGYTAVLTPNVPVAKEGIVVLDAEGQDITAYLDITVGTDNKITIAGLQNVDLTVKLSAENYDTLSVDVAVAEQNVEQNVTLQHSVYSVTVELLMDGAALEGMADAITVYAADDTSLTTPLDVEISFADGKYTVSGILGGTDVLVVFEAEGYVSERLNATPEQPDVTFNVRRIYNASFTVKAGDTYLTDESAITVAGANEGAQLAYDEDLQKFVITGLTNEIRITVKVAGYAEATQIFSADATTADIVLTAFDFSDLNAAIASAEQALAGASVSADGSDVATDAKWTTQAAADTFKAAIEAAKAALTCADTQEVVASAVDTLEAAQSAFTASLKAGTMQEQGPSDGGDSEGCGGCGSSAFAGWAGLSLGLIAAACVLLCLRKKSR